ncbi:MAG: hypothetical protein CL943_01280 [Candidatus Diapherotrites archaeon]|uniref:U32 family peptidase n=1 Tax=Candidatus Iainarchaeum sp. TaxID=3101447 RepID=A0A2D6M0G3_9ARCH|nr:hypothetical protein [Candidatus Diapherotrites archaeon]|tara:strand:+ start:2219 stop:3193 length:975 start_codon:yes stop_codon:yes gene_type:complete
MNILAPFSDQDEILSLINAGAKELYCGVIDQQWEKQYGYVSSINLRHDKIANLNSFEELEESVKQAHAKSAKVFLTLNAHYYSEKQLPIVMKQAGKALDLGVDSLIVADSALIPELRKEFDADVSLSTGNPVFNNSALDFFKQLGVSRVVFPRHLSLKEIEELSKHAKKIGLATEGFVLNVLCPHIDGLCTFQHLVEKNISFVPAGPLACRMPFKATAISSRPEESKRVSENHVQLWENTLLRDCGLCAVREFRKFGIDTVKIAGRAHSLEKKISDVEATKKAINLASTKNAEQFKEVCKGIYFDLFHNSCDYIHCYYAGAGLE